MPIERTAVEIRLNDALWPEDLSDASGPNALRRVFQEAQEAFQRYELAAQANLVNRAFSPAGVREANMAWARTNVPKLRESWAKAREHAAQVEAGLQKKLTGDFTQPATEMADIALLQEVRGWLSSLPEAERASRVRMLTSKGDKTVLRALLAVPAYLVPMPENELAAIRDEAIERADPERFALLRNFRKAIEVAERAVEGVAEFVEQEAAAPIPAIEARQRAAQGMPPAMAAGPRPTAPQPPRAA